MSSSEKKAQQARADRLRARIEKIKSGEVGNNRPQNPRDFIEQKMREAEKEKKSKRCDD